MENAYKIQQLRTDQGSHTLFAGPRIYQISIERPEATWVTKTISRIEDLTALARNWDTYGAEPIAADAAMRAVRFLLATTYGDLQTPAVVPLVDGGIQIEWHRGGIDLEIAFSDDSAGLYLEDEETGEVIETASLDDAATELQRVAPRLAAS